VATNSKRFSDQIVMVTGAAGVLGASMSHALAKEGATVVVTGHKEKPGFELAKAIGGDAIFVNLDVTDEVSWLTALDVTEKERGPLSVLINNAAYLAVGGVQTVPLAQWRTVIETNLTGTFLGIRAAAPSMRKAGGGPIVNISSIAGLHGTPGLAANGASKWGIRSLTRTAAYELARDNIRVNSVHPGIIDTPLAYDPKTGMELVPVDDFAIPRMALVDEIAAYVFVRRVRRRGVLHRVRIRRRWRLWARSHRSTPVAEKGTLRAHRKQNFKTQENDMDTTILITGTSSGLGRATAKLFHAKGWNVIATMRSPDQETELTKLDHTLVTRLDVQDSQSIQSAVEAGLAKFGRIGALVNNAGYGAYGPLEATPLEKMRRQFDVNVLGLLATIRAVLPHFRANKGGTIVNVSSIGGRIAFPLGTLYHGTKFAVEGLSESLHYELSALGIHVKIIEPGMIKTDFGGRSFDFNNDPELTGYQPLVQKLMDTFGPMMESASAPEKIAEVVYTAVTDGTDRLRYEAGPDASQVLSHRKSADDATFIAGIRAQFGLNPIRG